MDTPIAQPKPQELRDLLKRHSLARHEAATLLYVSTSAWHKWTSTGVEHRQIPTAIYELLLLKLGEHPTKKLVDK
ncbi:transcriptional regulator [Nitrosospira lacus]|uniref:Transcriptional regulator n=1 Tax=Nitrosospira lacus TaxID=1288494 RepID=A0A1W6STG1_9PROT|nr:transcriptional regulator [Nitrosospira lacus]